MADTVSLPVLFPDFIDVASLWPTYTALRLLFSFPSKRKCLPWEILEAP